MRPASFKFTCLLFFIFFTLILLGQKNFKPGYIVNQRLDTLKGMIDYRNWGKSPEYVVFAENEAAKKTTYYPGQIKMFEVEGEVYESAEINIDKSSTNIEQLSYTGDLEIVKDTVFLQVIVRGAKTLFYFKDSKNGADFFFTGNDKGVDWLIYKLYFQEDAEGRKVIEKNSRFQQQLTMYLAGCSSIQEKISKASYNHESLEEVFREYNKCVNTASSFQKPREKIYLETGIVGGINLTQFKFSGGDSDPNHVTKANFKNSTGIACGVFLNVAIMRNLQRVFLYNELFYSDFSTTGQYLDFHNSEYYRNSNYTIGLSYIKFNTMVRYKIPINKTNIFFQVGISNGFVIKETNYAKTEIRFYSADSIEIGKVVGGLKKYEIGVLAGIGAQVNRLSFEVRYENGSRISDISTGIARRLYVLFGFRF